METQNIYSTSGVANALAPYFQQMKDYFVEKMNQLIATLDFVLFGDQNPQPLVSRDVQDLTSASDAEFIPIALQKLKFCQSQRLDFSPVEAVPYPGDRGDAERAKRQDADKGKNQFLECDGYTKRSDFSPELGFLNDTYDSGADFSNHLDFLNNTHSIQKTLFPILGKDASTITYSDATTFTHSINRPPLKSHAPFTETVAIAKERFEVEQDFSTNREAIQAALAPFKSKPSNEITLDDALQFIQVTDEYFSGETPIETLQLPLLSKIQKAKEAMVEKKGEHFLVVREFTAHKKEIKPVLAHFLNKNAEEITYPDVHNILSFLAPNEPIKHDPETPLLKRVQDAITQVSSNMFTLDAYYQKHH